MSGSGGAACRGADVIEIVDSDDEKKPSSSAQRSGVQLPTSRRAEGGTPAELVGRRKRRATATLAPGGGQHARKHGFMTSADVRNSTAFEQVVLSCRA